MAEERNTEGFFRHMELMLLGLFNLTRVLSYLLPPSLLYSMFSLVGYPLYYLRKGMRDHLIDNISGALPEIGDADEIRRIARRACCALFLPMLDLVILGRYRKKVMDKLVVEGVENLDKADAQGKGVIVITSHMGAFSIGTSVLARLGKPISPIGLHPSLTTTPRYSKTLMIFAECLGCDREAPIFFVGEDTINRVREHLNKGRRVGIAYDVTGDYVVDFCGRPTALASGIAFFARDMESPILPTTILRTSKPLEFRLIFGEPITYELSDDRKADVANIMTAVARTGENLIREAPDQWMSWFGLNQWREKALELQEREKAPAAA